MYLSLFKNFFFLFLILFPSFPQLFCPSYVLSLLPPSHLSFSFSPAPHCVGLVPFFFPLVKLSLFCSLLLSQSFPAFPPSVPTSPLNQPSTSSPPPHENPCWWLLLVWRQRPGLGSLEPSNWLPSPARQMKSRPPQWVNALLRHLLLAGGPSQRLGLRFTQASAVARWIKTQPTNWGLGRGEGESQRGRAGTSVWQPGSPRRERPSIGKQAN